MCGGPISPQLVDEPRTLMNNPGIFMDKLTSPTLHDKQSHIPLMSLQDA
jgi:hypothetical protein